MHSADYNLHLLKVMIEALKDFLLSKEVFWSLGGKPSKGEPPFPQLSIGQLQLTLKEVEAVEGELKRSQSVQWMKYRDRAWALRRKWTTAMALKSLAEASQRVNLWWAYLNEIKEAGGRSDNYSYEVRHRVILELLSEFTQLLDDESLQAQIKVLDGILRRFLSDQSGFVWAQPLSKVYPDENYWFLYRQPPKR